MKRRDKRQPATDALEALGARRATWAYCPVLAWILCVSCLFSLSGATYASIQIEILERYDRNDLTLSGIRWRDGNNAWQACFRTPAGFYVTTYEGQFIGHEMGKIIHINMSSVLIREYFPIEKDLESWDSRDIELSLPENADCDWKNAVPNYAVFPEDDGFRKDYEAVFPED
jgi:hypothetical protein